MASPIFAFHLNPGDSRTTHEETTVKGLKMVPEVVDPPKSSGLVITQLRTRGSHAMFHPVFKLPETIDDSAELKADYVEEEPQKSIVGTTSVIVRRDFVNSSDASGSDLVNVDLLSGFCGVCISNTQLKRRYQEPRTKRRRHEDPRIAVAVAGTVTMPFFEMPEAHYNDNEFEQRIKPGDLVAFAVFNKDSMDSNVRVLRGTNSESFVRECVPRIRKFNSESCGVAGQDFAEKPPCSAPFGVCVGVDPEEFQITVLLRMDLYHSHYYA